MLSNFRRVVFSRLTANIFTPAARPGRSPHRLVSRWLASSPPWTNGGGSTRTTCQTCARCFLHTPASPPCPTTGTPRSLGVASRGDFQRLVRDLIIDHALTPRKTCTSSFRGNRHWQKLARQSPRRLATALHSCLRRQKFQLQLGAGSGILSGWRNPRAGRAGTWVRSRNRPS